jgi:aldose 1-epimerase
VPAAPEILTIGAGTLRVAAAPELGGSLTRFWSEDGRGGAVEWLRPASAAALAARDPLGVASFPLVPFCNRIRDGRFAFRGERISLGINPPEARHAIHGQGWQRPWSVLAREEWRIALGLTHLRDAWPFRYSARQEIRLAPDRLTVELQLRNEDERPMPAGIGHHPYYPRTKECRIAAAATGFWETDAEVMPTRLVPPPPSHDLRPGLLVDAVEMDNNYSGWDGAATIEWPERRARLTMRAGPPYDFLVVYTPAGQDFFVFEPVSNSTDAFNLRATRDDTGAVVLAPGETLAASFELIPEIL